MASAWLQFVVCAALIASAGAKLPLYADVIADKTGVSGHWIGMILLATVTSLPELVTGVAAVALADVPDIAAGNVFGSCMLNLTMLVVIDFLYRSESFYRRANQAHMLSAAFGIVLIGLSGMSLLLGSRIAWLAIGHVGIHAPLTLLLYLTAARAASAYDREQRRELVEETASRYPDISLREAAIRYTLAAAVVVTGGVWLPFIGERLAEVMGWHGSFVGTLFIAGATTLPELAVTLSALRAGSLDMAIANLLGSDLFNMLILAIDDLFYLKGPLLAHVSSIHAFSAASATVMTGLVVAGLSFRPRKRMLHAVGWVSIGLFAVYLANAYVLYRHG